MPISLDDQARLPPMIPYDILMEKERSADMKEFRKYLVETGTAACLVKLYKHIAKNEMRLDNDRILKEFFETHSEETDATREADVLSEENATLKDKNAELKAQVEALSKELNLQQRLALGKRIWQNFVAVDFWAGHLNSTSDADISGGLPLKLLFHRLCGQKPDKATGKPLVNLLRPPSLDEEAVSSSPAIELEAFSSWIANDISDSLYAWCQDELAVRLEGEDKSPPYENDLVQAIRESGLYPGRLDEVADSLIFDPPLNNLFKFLEAVASRFRGGDDA